MRRFLLSIRVPGFEPGNGGTKNRCLTAWRHPIMFPSKGHPLQGSGVLKTFTEAVKHCSRDFSQFEKQRHNPSKSLAIPTHALPVAVGATSTTVSGNGRRRAAAAANAVDAIRVCGTHRGIVGAVEITQANGAISREEVVVARRRAREAAIIRSRTTVLEAEVVGPCAQAHRRVITVIPWRRTLLERLEPHRIRLARAVPAAGRVQRAILGDATARPCPRIADRLTDARRAPRWRVTHQPLLAPLIRGRITAPPRADVAIWLTEAPAVLELQARPSVSPIIAIGVHRTFGVEADLDTRVALHRRQTTLTDSAPLRRVGDRALGVALRAVVR